ncbi:hypothetical protein SASPL_144641 [Salvia splendens]|uniref:Protein kinase domain-containing protein n=1 Tax=Salvia splendens TaxID=180675 RepID=A0A8X8Z6N4_SALSN|nr:hypothetical protein SASPL_144641 [Salvia splendens]
MILEEMSILSCCRISKSEIKKKSLKNSKSWVYDDGDAYSTVPRSVSLSSGAIKQRILAEEALRNGNARVPAEVFTFRELATATQNFNSELLVGEGGFGRVYKGYLNKTNQIVAVKQLDRNGVQGNREFLAEVLTLSLVHHANLVNLIGYCADGRQRILIISGRRAIDGTKPPEEENLVDWAKPLFKDRRKFTLMADPLLEGNYPVKGLYQALAVAAMCIQDEAGTRPLIADVVTALEYLAIRTAEAAAAEMADFE